jgi:PBSX family phage terminase large subunit
MISDRSIIGKLKPLSKKAIASIKTRGWMTVWEGAVRSGKTVASLIAWIVYVCNSPERQFVMTGNTFASLIHNTIDGEFGLLNLFEGLLTMRRDASGANCLYIMGKKILLFGAHDESDYKRIKGLTVGGWYADEVATHPESFIVEAMNRTVASQDRRLFWTLNPCVPSHYIYRNFTDLWEGSPGYHRFHFTLDDNLSLSDERKAELANQYVGRFKAINILGLRVAAEGVVYDCFTQDLLYSEPPNLENAVKYIACDYGTINPCVFLLCEQNADGMIYVTREFRWDSRKMMAQKTDEQYVEDMKNFAGPPDKTDCNIIVDPSASSFITALTMAGYCVIKGNNDVMLGIRRVSSLMARKRLRISRECTGLIAELEAYCWDEKACQQRGEERPLKINDHGPDALRYYCMTALTMYDL